MDATSIRRVFALVATLICIAAPARGQVNPKGPEYTAVVSSFDEELTAIEELLLPAGTKTETAKIHGIEFKTAEIGGRHFVFLVTGMSLVNAAMNTQLALDHYNITALFFTGIAGGIDPALHAGDVVIPAKWHYHAEAVYVNETAPGKFALPGYFKQKYLNYGMIFPEDVTVKREGMSKWAQVSSFAADEKLLALARAATATMPPMKLGDRTCQIVYGGDGVSGTVFCDNADYRQWVFKVWQAQCLDMESTAIAQACWENKVPCLIVRGLSDLAGGQAGPNEIDLYTKAAAENSARVLVRILQNLGSTP